jgi:hypothetical protein
MGLKTHIQTVNSLRSFKLYRRERRHRRVEGVVAATVPAMNGQRPLAIHPWRVPRFAFVVEVDFSQRD